MCLKAEGKTITLADGNLRLDADDAPGRQVGTPCVSGGLSAVRPHATAGGTDLPRRTQLQIATKKGQSRSPALSLLTVERLAYLPPPLPCSFGVEALGVEVLPVSCTPVFCV
jgi:hypothetical protein